MAVDRSLKSFAVIALVMQVFFAIIYGFHQGYPAQVGYSDMNGLLVAVYLIMLLLVGFGLLSVYLKEFSLTGMTLNFIMLAFTIQWYFLVKKFWYSINLGDPTNTVTLNQNPHNIRLSGILHYNNGVNVGDMQFFTLGQAVACAISMYVILFPNMGRVGPGEAIIICIVGNFAYTLNEVSFWRLNINDNGYGMRIFLFGSVAGLTASIVLSLMGGKQHSINHPKYYSQYSYQALALLGSIFVWILLPWLSVIEQAQVTTNAPTFDYRQVAPLNIFYALSASASGSFITSIYLRGKIAVHDVAFGCFSGAIGYGASSNVFPNPFPAILIGFICGILVTFLNTKKRGLNEGGVIDSLGSISVFLVPSFIGAIYSAILYASSPYGPDNSDNYVQMDPSLNRFRQGGYQLAGLLITIGIALATGALIGFLMKFINTTDSPQDLFDDNKYLQKDNNAVITQDKIRTDNHI